MTWAHWSKSTPWKDRERLIAGIRCNSKWNRWRRKYLMRNPRCVDCGLAGEEVHHMIPRAQAPALMYDEANVVTLCRKCHADRHLRSPAR